MSNILMFLAAIIFVIYFIVSAINAAFDFTTDKICKQAYAAKVSQQIPACKEWEDNIDKMKSMIKQS